MKGIILTMNENKKYTIIKNLVDSKGNKYRAAIKLNCSIRSINRMIKNYKENGKLAFYHKNHDKKPAITINQNIKDQIVELYTNKYSGFNFSHFNELLKKNENISISYNALFKLLTTNNFISPKARRITKRNFQKQVNSKPVLNNEDILISSNEIDIKSAHPRQERAKYRGEIVQLDASVHHWFGKTKSYLHLAIDDSDSSILAAHFDKQETINGYYNVLCDILLNDGIPNKFVVDRRTIFVYNSLVKKALEKDTFTQFSFACSLLGIDIETTSIPQSKGKVERSFNTHQDRLINELKLLDITTIEEANKYLKNTYIDNHNNKFALQKKNITSVFEKQPSKEQIDLILSIRSERIIDKGHSIKYKNKYYQTYQNKELITLKPKSKCIVIEAFNGELYLESADKVYELKELNQHKEISDTFDLDMVQSKSVDKVSKPASNHPWRHSTIINHQKNIKGNIKTLEEYYDDCIPLERI